MKEKTYKCRNLTLNKNKSKPKIKDNYSVMIVKKPFNWHDKKKGCNILLSFGIYKHLIKGFLCDVFSKKTKISEKKF